MPQNQIQEQMRWDDKLLPAMNNPACKVQLFLGRPVATQRL